MTEKGCSAMIKAVWIENVLDSWDTKVLKKIDKCGHELSWWSKKCFGNVRRDLDKKRKELQEVERVLIRIGYLR